MNVTSLANMGLRMGQVGHPVSPGASANTAGNLTAPATKRVTRELESTNVKLSAFGQIKSSFSGTQTAAKDLQTSATSKTATNADVEKAAQAFVSAYNQAAQSVKNATGSSAKQAGALSTDFRAKAAGNDLTRSLTSGNGLANLKQAGITMSKDGTLSLDTKALQKSLQSDSSGTKSALANMGQQVSDAAGKELASTGNVGTSVEKLSTRAKTLTAQQTSLQQETASLQAKLEKQSATLNYATASGLAAYQNILG